MKKIFIFICILSLMHAVTLPVLADTVDSGTVNSAALSYFTGVVNKLPANSDYVIYRSGTYSTTMVYGYKFDSSNSFITCNSTCTKVVYDTRGSGSTGNYVPTLSTSELDSFSLSTDNQSILYSSVGSWASVGETNKDNVSYILWSVVLLIFLFVVYKHFRNRRHYINL